MFRYEEKEFFCGQEFLSHFVCGLKCRIFVADQYIFKIGDEAENMYMVFKGRVALSLKNKKENEFFTLYPSNYFGDYQILLDLRVAETYTVLGSEPVFTHFIKAEKFKDLMRLFPDALNCFLMKAIDRRTEFRRIKKLF
jgi:CRP-like cAMP-binding protein